MLTYAIGDIHGMGTMLEGALAAIAADAGGRARRVVFLGDYFDRGTENRKVFSILRAGPPDPAEEWVLLAGNHCRMMIEAVLRDRDDGWIMNGGMQVLSEYGLRPSDPRLVDDVRWLEANVLPYFRDEDEGRLFVHAGIRPGVPLERQHPEDMAWIRDEFLEWRYDHGFLVVHGHTPVRNGVPEILSNRVNLDTAAVYGGRLSVGAFEDGEPRPARIISAANPKSGPVRFTTVRVDAPKVDPVAALRSFRLGG